MGALDVCHRPINRQKRVKCYFKGVKIVSNLFEDATIIYPTGEFMGPSIIGNFNIAPVFGMSSTIAVPTTAFTTEPVGMPSLVSSADALAQSVSLWNTVPANVFRSPDGREWQDGPARSRKNTGIQAMADDEGQKIRSGENDSIAQDILNYVSEHHSNRATVKNQLATLEKLAHLFPKIVMPALDKALNEGNPYAVFVLCALARSDAPVKEKAASLLHEGNFKSIIDKAYAASVDHAKAVMEVYHNRIGNIGLCAFVRNAARPKEDDFSINFINAVMEEARLNNPAAYSVIRSWITIERRAADDRRIVRQLVQFLVRQVEDGESSLAAEALKKLGKDDNIINGMLAGMNLDALKASKVKEVASLGEQIASWNEWISRQPLKLVPKP